MRVGSHASVRTRMRECVYLYRGVHFRMAITLTTEHSHEHSDNIVDRVLRSNLKLRVRVQVLPVFWEWFSRELSLDHIPQL